MTRQEKAKAALISAGYRSALDMPCVAFGENVARNKSITQDVIFDGKALNVTGDDVGLSHERVRQIALKSVRMTLGRYE